MAQLVESCELLGPRLDNYSSMPATGVMTVADRPDPAALSAGSGSDVEGDSQPAGAGKHVVIFAGLDCPTMLTA